jgi:uncharacterized protein YndB with AHSA1/START domain
MKTTLHTVHIHAPPAKVYHALTGAAGLAGWWSTRVRIDDGDGRIHFTFGADFNPVMRPGGLVTDRRTPPPSRSPSAKAKLG